MGEQNLDLGLGIVDKADVSIVTQSQVFQSRQPCVVSKVPGTFICEIEGLPQIVEWCRGQEPLWQEQRASLVTQKHMSTSQGPAREQHAI